MTAFLTPQSEDASRVSHRPEEWRAQMTNLALADLAEVLALISDIPQSAYRNYRHRALHMAGCFDDTARRITRLGAA